MLLLLLLLLLPWLLGGLLLGLRDIWELYNGGVASQRTDSVRELLLQLVLLLQPRCLWGEGSSSRDPTRRRQALPSIMAPLLQLLLQHRVELLRSIGR